MLLEVHAVKVKSMVTKLIAKGCAPCRAILGKVQYFLGGEEKI